MSTSSVTSPEGSNLDELKSLLLQHYNLSNESFRMRQVNQAIERILGDNQFMQQIESEEVIRDLVLISNMSNHRIWTSEPCP